MGNRAHGADGQFRGAHRVNVENVPRLPTFPAAWTMDDPRKCSYFIFWMDSDASIYLSLRMEQIDGGQAIQISTPFGDRFAIKILRQPLPANGATTILYVCPWCARLPRYLYPLTVVRNQLVGYQGPRCRACAGLRWASQGKYQDIGTRALSASARRPGHARSPVRREPWDPRAVSHPRLLAVEFPALVFKEASSPAAE